MFWLTGCGCFGRFTEVHGFEKPHDERGLGLMNAAAVVRGMYTVCHLGILYMNVLNINI